jgi:hypothetical protein
MNSPFLEILENLSHVCRSCAEKFEAAAAGCENEERHERFVERAEQFGNYVWDLQEEILRFGQDRVPERGRFVMSDAGDSAARNSVVETKDEEPTSGSCLQCIEKAENEYRRAMEDRVLSDSIKGLLRRHHVEIQGALRI